MSRRNYWTTLRQRKISRRTMLGASAKAGVGAAGLALVGCGDDDEPDAGAVAAERAAAAAEEAAAAAVAAGEARAAESEAAAAVAAEAADAAADAAAAAGEASAAAGEASDAAAQAASAADAAAALAAEAAESEDAANAAAAAEAAAAAAADAAAAASAAGDQAAAAVAAAASEAAEAAAQAARDAAAAVEAGTATAEAAQAAIDEAAEAAAAAAAAAGEASAAAGQAAATAAETAATAAETAATAEAVAEAAAETAAAAVAAAEEAADAAREAAESAAMATAEDEGPAAGEVDFGATLRIAAASDNGGLDPIRAGSQTNFVNSHGIFDRSVNPDPGSGEIRPNLMTWENPDDVTWNMTVKDQVFFHNGQQLTAEDIIFTHERAGGIAEYHQGGETSDHPAAWASSRKPFGAQHWLSYAQTDKLHWTFTTDGPDATILGSTLWIPYVMSKADTEERGDAAVDAASMGTGYMRFVSHAEDTDFIFTRNDDYHNEWSRTVTPNGYQAASYKNQVHLVRPEPLSRIAGIEAGEIDVAYLMGADIVAPIEDDPDLEVTWGFHTTATTNIMPNLNFLEVNGEPNPFLDERVRKALNHAINKQAIIDNLLTGDEDVSYGLFPAMIASPIEALRAIGPYAYDPDLAKALLAEAGYPDGFSTTIHYLPTWTSQYGPMAQAVQQDFAAVGVEAELNALPQNEFFSQARSLEIPGLWWFPFGLGAEQQGNLGAFYTLEGTYALTPYDDLEDAYQRQLRSVDIDDRTEAMHDLLVGHYERAGFIYLTELRAAHVTAPHIEWPLGAGQLANEQAFAQINVLTT